MSRDLFGRSKAFIGVVHLLPLPGSPRWRGNMRAVIDRAEEIVPAIVAAAAASTNGEDPAIIEKM